MTGNETGEGALTLPRCGSGLGVRASQSMNRSGATYSAGRKIANGNFGSIVVLP